MTANNLLWPVASHHHHQLSPLHIHSLIDSRNRNERIKLHEELDQEATQAKP